MTSPTGEPVPAGPVSAGGEVRLAVAKTYKLFVGGAFPRSESGRVTAVTTAAGEPWANAARASRKDVRDAVRAARAALPKWSGATAYNRGQVIYRAAEMLEGRRAQFAAEVARADGLPAAAATAVVAKTVDRLVWYAGWTDKLAQVLGTVNPVAGPFLNLSTPEPTGVVGLVAPRGSSLLGLVSRLAPVIAGGNTCVVVADEARPLPAVTFAEVLATSDLPGGTVNILTGRTAELVPTLAAHRDVDGLDLAGLDALTGGATVPPEEAGADPESTSGSASGADAHHARLRRDAAVAAADSVKRIAPPCQVTGDGWLDDTRGQDLEWVAAFLETKTVWHPSGV